MNNKAPSPIKISLKNAFLYSPLLGGFLSSIIWWLYAISTAKESLPEMTVISIITGALSLYPLYLFGSIIFSYLLFYPLLFISKKIQDKFYLSEKQFWFIIFVIGLLVGIIFGGINYHYENLPGKFTIILFICSFCTLFNASLFSVLSGKIKS